MSDEEYAIAYLVDFFARAFRTEQLVSHDTRKFRAHIGKIKTPG